jgi:kynurenine formamidase
MKSTIVTRFTDLTHRIRHEMPVYPGDPQTSLKPLSDFESQTFYSSRLGISMHCGTHIDAPFHMVKSGKKLFEYPPEIFIGPAVIVNAPGSGAIGPEILDGVKLDNASFLLIRTGHSSNYEEAEYYTAYPFLSEELAHLIIQTKVKIIGLDTPSPDYVPFPVHHIFFNADRLIIENLTNLDHLPAGVPLELIALPLLIDAEASPVRVLAKVS